MMFGGFSWLFIILIFAAMFLIGGCGWRGGCGVSRSHRRSSNDFNNNSDAIEILNKRYASGEIDSEEYNRKKKEILNR